MPSVLPAELIHRIIVLSLPTTISFDALPARYALLKQYSLVSRSWTPWAQLELYRHVLLRQADKRAVDLKTTTRGSEVLLAQTHSLRVETSTNVEESTALRRILPGFSHLRDLRVTGACFSFEMLGSLKSA